MSDGPEYRLKEFLRLKAEFFLEMEQARKHMLNQMNFECDATISSDEAKAFADSFADGLTDMLGDHEKRLQEAAEESGSLIAAAERRRDLADYHSRVF